MNKKIENIKVDEEQVGLRIDSVIAEKLGRNRSYVKKLIEQGAVSLNGHKLKAGYKVKMSDQITVVIPDERKLGLIPSDVKLDILYEDSSIIVVNKPAGMVVHPGQGDSHQEDTLVNALMSHCKDLQKINDVIRPGIVHRIDKDTSGVLVVAKNEKSMTELSRQFKDREVRKRYIALVAGRINPSEATIDSPIGRDAHNRKKMSIVDGKRGRNAVTKYVVRRFFEKYSLLDVDIETGRTHQIRVHLAAIGYPIAGDFLYGKKSVNKEIAQVAGLERQFLHASRIVFSHPDSGKTMVLEAPLPEDLIKVIELI